MGRILVADDHDSLRRGIVRALSDNRFHVIANYRRNEARARDVQTVIAEIQAGSGEVGKEAGLEEQSALVAARLGAVPPDDHDVLLAVAALAVTSAPSWSTRARRSASRTIPTFKSPAASGFRWAR